MKGGRNHEGFPDPTATIAIGNVMREAKKSANKLVRQKERSSDSYPSDPEGKRHHKKRGGKKIKRSTNDKVTCGMVSHQNTHQNLIFCQVSNQ